MVSNKKQQQEYADTVKDYTRIGQFGTNIYFSWRDSSLVIIYSQTNNLILTFDLITREFKQSLYSDLIRITKVDNVEISKLKEYLDILVAEFREAIIYSSKVVKAESSSKKPVVDKVNKNTTAWEEFVTSKPYLYSAFREVRTNPANEIPLENG